jgi:hypothetical protein
MEKLNTGAFWKVAIAQDGFGNLIKRSLGLSNAATDFKVYPMVCCENRAQVLIGRDIVQENILASNLHSVTWAWSQLETLPEQRCSGPSKRDHCTCLAFL